MCGLTTSRRGLGRMLKPIVKDTWSPEAATKDIVTTYAWLDCIFPSKRVLGKVATSAIGLERNTMQAQNHSWGYSGCGFMLTNRNLARRRLPRDCRLYPP